MAEAQHITEPDRHHVTVLPENVRTHVFARSTHAHTNLVKEAQGNWQHSNNVTRLVITKQFDELQPAESRAVDKVLALP